MNEAGKRAMTDTFKAATVLLSEPFSRESGYRLGKALAQALGCPPSACWLFSAPEGDLAGLVSGVREAVETDNLIGCTTDGEISSDGFTTGSAVLAGIAAEGISFQVIQAGNLSRDSEAAGRRLAEAFDSDVRYIQIFSDGLTGNGCAILRGMHSVVSADVPVGGGTAGDGGQFIRTWQFIGDRILTDAVVGIGWKGDFSIGTGVSSGWAPVGLAKKVTRASGNVLYELNGEPALHVYERFLGKHAAKLPAVGVEYPLGIISECSENQREFLLLRATMSVDRAEGSIRFAGEIPEGAMVHLTCGDSASILKAAEEAYGQAMDMLDGHAPGMVFFYSCMARKTVLGLHTRDEFARIRRKMPPGLPMIGFYTYGEYCPLCSGGASILHNETATLSIIGV